MPGFRFKTVLEVPLELNTCGPVSPRRHECTTKLRRHNDFSNELFIEEVAGKGRYPPTVTAYADAQAAKVSRVHVNLESCLVRPIARG